MGGEAGKQVGQEQGPESLGIARGGSWTIKVRPGLRGWWGSPLRPRPGAGCELGLGRAECLLPCWLPPFILCVSQGRRSHSLPAQEPVWAC